MNLAIDHLRKHKRVKPVDFTENALGDTDNPTADDRLLPTYLGANPSRALADKQIRERISAALAGLTENHRAVLVMRELEGLSYEEMADAMGCSKGTIMSRLFHARRNMQRQLGDLFDGGRGQRGSEGPAAADDDEAGDGSEVRDGD
jgi:RNA polymerase sigma-70 factor (ECF subfamily)